MTETTTIQLDPEAVEAAAEAIEVQFAVLGSESTQEATAAITAFIAAIEPKLRERVIAYNDTTWDCVVAQERGMAQAEVAKRYEAFQDADTALYALFGLEAE